VTAAHCVAWAPKEGVTADEFWVTFDSEVTFDPETAEVTSSNDSPAHPRWRSTQRSDRPPRVLTITGSWC
jgi:hypothetical protein